MERFKLKILEDLCIDVNETNTEIVFKEGDIVEKYSVMIRNNKIVGYWIEGYFVPKDAVEVLKNGTRQSN